MEDIFASPIATDAPSLPKSEDHPVARTAVKGTDGLPVQTNRWYANLMLGTGMQGVWTLPYMVWMSKDDAHWGLSVSHTDANQLATGPDPAANPVQYYISPLGIRSFTFSAAEFNSSTSSFSIDSPASHSVNLNLYQDIRVYGTDTNKIVLPLVQGMGFVTARYYRLVPVLGSGVLFRSVTPASAPRGTLQKWTVVLEDGKKWLVYATPNGGVPNLTLRLQGNDKLVGDAQFTGYIQIAKLSDPGQEGVIDSAAGAFPVTSKVSGSVDGTTGTYSLFHSRFGQNNAGVLLMYALAHHLSSFAPDTAANVTGLSLCAPTKGMMWGVLSDKWSLVETGLPANITWLPLDGAVLTPAAVDRVRSAAQSELQQDMDTLSDLDSMYFSGKVLAKFAQIVLAAATVVKDVQMAKSGLDRLVSAMGRFTKNEQKFKLVYDVTWKGVVSEAYWKTNDPNVDFGNSFYNDHHFHYAYFIYTAAVIGYVDQLLNGGQPSAWVAANKAWVNALVRDVANPSSTDPYFPVWRSFDWFCGHSWAKGLFESADGKDQESTSEDYNFAYGMKLWGSIVGDRHMEARGSLMLAVMRRSMNLYFLLSDDNLVHPANFIKNRVTGILFENKVDHATYFGLNPEYIQGIHMLPLTPMSTYIRHASFCKQEWDTFFSNGRAEKVNSGWRGVLFANLAIFDAKAAWKFFTEGFSPEWLDNGASLTWYLVFVAGLGGAS